jgi:hypothetical protein
MTALAADKSTKKRGAGVLAEQFELDVAASVEIFAGAMVAVDTSGNAKPAAAATALAATNYGLRVVGRAEEYVDNSDGSAGDETVKVTRGVFGFVNSSNDEAVTVADILDKCYLVDDQTVSRNSNLGLRPVCGTVIGIEDSVVYVEVGTDPKPHEIRLLASADLSASQFCFVKLTNVGKVALCGAGENAIGVLQNSDADADGAIAIVKTFGFTKVKASGNLTPGASLASDASGKAKAASAAIVNTSDAGAASDPVVGSYVLGDLLEDATADGEFAVMFFCRQGAIPTTAA